MSFDDPGCLDALLLYLYEKKEYDALRTLAKTNRQIRGKMREMKKCGRLAYKQEEKSWYMTELTCRKKFFLNGRLHCLDGPASIETGAIPVEKFYSHGKHWGTFIGRTFFHNFPDIIRTPQSKEVHKAMLLEQMRLAEFSLSS